jgi:hypothetical protein
VATQNEPNPADDPLDYSSLWYSDPTGNQAVKNLMAGDYAITDAAGFTIVIDAASLRPALALYDYSLSRTGKSLRARLKRKAPELRQQFEGNASETPTAK